MSETRLEKAPRSAINTMESTGGPLANYMLSISIKTQTAGYGSAQQDVAGMIN